MAPKSCFAVMRISKKGTAFNAKLAQKLLLIAIEMRNTARKEGKSAGNRRKVNATSNRTGGERRRPKTTARNNRMKGAEKKSQEKLMEREYLTKTKQKNMKLQNQTSILELI